MSDIDYTGRTINERYKILRILGKGGMGAVYLGQHLFIGKKVAVKFLHAEFVKNEEVVKRFYREAQAAASIRHKNIIDILDVGVSQEGEPYLVMEYLEGESLAGMLKRMAPLEPAAACAIVEPLLRALSEVHSKNIVHRDLKPDNIFLVFNQGQAPDIKLIDFGISKFTSESAQTNLTRTGMMIGTPAYMSREQANGDKDVDHRTDLYSMGVILYEMLTGKLPFVGEHPNALLVNLITNDPRPPKSIYPEFPDHMEPCLMKALAKDPDERFQSADEMITALRTMTSDVERMENLTKLGSFVSNSTVASGDLGDPVSSRRESRSAEDLLMEMATPSEWAGTGLARPKKSRKGLYAGIAAAVVALLVAGYFVLLPQGKPKTVPAVQPGPQSVKQVLPEVKAKETAAQITVKGAPEGARIYYNNLRVPTNPFDVKKDDGMVPVRVEAKGFEKFESFVVPDKDRTINVTMNAVPEVKKQTTKPRTRTKPRRKTSGKEQKPAQSIVIKPVEEKSAGKPTDKKSDFTKAGRGTKFVEDVDDFE